MNHRGYILIAALIGAGSCATAACAGPDQGLVTFKEGETETEASQINASPASPSKPQAKTDSGAAAPVGTVNATFAADVFPIIKTECGTCHAAGGTGPTIIGADAAATYAIFKQRNWVVANSPFTTKGQHSGAPLTAAAQAAITKWIGTEGATTPDGGT